MRTWLKPVAESGLALMLMWLAASDGQAQTISARRLVEVADLANPAVSPDGAWVAVRLEQASVEHNTYATAWYITPMDGATPPRRVADGGVLLRNSAGGPLPAPAIWSADGRWIYYRALLDGRIGIWRAAADGSGAEPLTDDPADVRDVVPSADGTALFYSVGPTREEVIAAEQAEYDSGIRIDERVPIGQVLFRSGLIEGRPATQRYSGVWFDRAPLLADVPDRWRALDLLTGNVKDVLRPDLPQTASQLPADQPRPWKIAQDPRGRIALLTRIGEQRGLRDRPGIRLSTRDGPSGPSLTCASDLCTNKAISGIQWRPASDDLLFTVTDPDEGHAQTVFRWNVLTDDVQPVARASGLLSGGRDTSSACGISAAALACVTAEANRPPRLERIDLDSGQRQVLFDPNSALAQDMSQAAPVQLLRWTDAKGRQFTGQFFPAHRGAARGAPLFVSYYLCPGFLRGGFGDEWPLATLAGHGIAALCINRPPNAPLDAVERFDLGLAAVGAIVDQLAAEGAIDAAKVGMGGLSFGSEVALWTATKSDLLAAVSVSSPPITPHYYLLGSLKGQMFADGLQRFWQLGAPDETPERWRTISPVYQLDQVAAPILFQMAEQEYLHALDLAIPLIRMQRADLYVYPDEPHQKFQPKHKLAVYERNLDWFRFWLQGIEDPDPAKIPQYAYWRGMKAAPAASNAGRSPLPTHPVLDHAKVDNPHE